ncbi:MAG TPA: hypothetical protein VEC16_05130 [Alphaproteobacteria bacterium]|nr:hypothetical protein [Alphaproteobacteria bacterium]
MNLTRVHFTYNIENRNFKRMHYSFEVFSSAKESKDIDEGDVNELAKSSLKTIEDVIETEYRSFKKTETGEIDSIRIKFGHEYKPRFALLAFSTANVKFDLQLGKNNTTESLSIEYINTDSNAKRMLKIHDKILEISDLSIEKDAKVQLEKIRYIRSPEFNLETYLKNML